MAPREGVMIAAPHKEPERVLPYVLSIDPKFIEALGGGDPLRVE